MSAASFQFGEFELDCERFELLRNGRPVRLERKPLELLILLASGEGRLVTRPEISRRLWDTEVFVDTEHGINTAIRKIRTALREDPEKPRFLQTVTGKGYRLVGVISKPQLAPDASSLRQFPGSEDGATVGRLTSSQVIRSPGRRPWLAVTLTSAAAAALLVVFVFGIRRAGGHTAKPAITSLAVLPLDNLSGDPSQNYLADGMTDELTTMLAKDSTLRIVSRTSVMQYKGAHRPLPQIARALNVDGIVEGSISRSGNLLHMTVQLIHAPTDTHVWADSYDRDANDLLSLPRDIALTVAKETRSTVASTPPQKYVNPAAHNAYLRGHYLWFSGNDRASGQYFLKATQLQPDYALAWAGLSSYYGAGAVDDYLDPRTALPLSAAAARKSMQLDPSLPEAHLNFAAGVYWLTDWNLEAALGELDHALELDPKLSEAWHLRGKILIQLNRYQEGIDMERKANEIDPFERPWALSYALLMSRQFDAAIADAKQRLEGNPVPALWWILSEAYRGKGMDKESEQALEKALLLWNDSSDLEGVHRAFARGGRRAVLHWYISHDRSQAKKGYQSPFRFASLYAQLGDKQQALASLDECLRQHSPALLDLQNDTAFDSLHSDPHYRAIIRKIGLPPAW